MRKFLKVYFISLALLVFAVVTTNREAFADMVYYTFEGQIEEINGVNTASYIPDTQVGDTVTYVIALDADLDAYYTLNYVDHSPYDETRYDSEGNLIAVIDTYYAEYISGSTISQFDYSEAEGTVGYVFSSYNTPTYNESNIYLTDGESRIGFEQVGLPTDLSIGSEWQFYESYDTIDGWQEDVHFWGNATIIDVSTLAQSEPVPEPTTLSLLGIGIVGLIGGAARCKLKRKAITKG